MTEKPILFSGPMVRAILEGRKTQTRRVLKVPETHGHFVGIYAPGLSAVFSCNATGPNDDVSIRLYSKGDLLWVREAFCYDVVERPPYDVNGNPTCEEIVRYRATDKDEGTAKWKPSIHMPRWASRITLEVTAVKVERLQDISEEDAKAEGVTLSPERENRRRWQHPYGYQFQELWNSINGPGSWDANPWVAAYSFKRVLPE